MRTLRLVHSNPRLDSSGTVVHPTRKEAGVEPLDPDVRALLEHVRIIAPVPRGVRARVLARARATIAAAACPAPTPARRRARTIF